MRKLLILILSFGLVLLIGCKSQEVTVESIMITGDQEVWLGEIGKLEAIVNPTEVSQSVRWTSNDESIVVIDAYGNLIPQKEGSAIITATHASNSNIKATIQIIVRDHIPTIVMEYYHTKILSINRTLQNIELKGVPYQEYNEETTIVKRINNGFETITINELYIGLDNIYVEVNPQTNKITHIIMDGERGFQNIRVAIRKNIDDISLSSTLYHDSVELYPRQNAIIKTYDDSIQATVVANSSLQAEYIQGKIVVSSGSTILLSTDKRVILEQSSQGTVEIRSIRRSLGIPAYQGNIEISIVGGRLLVVNDVNLENYLTKVVPSEMPASFHVEALKSQAIAARTYAYMDILRKTHEQYGYTVDDSVSSQVYNNQSTNSNTSMAVYQTAGLVMMNQGVPIQAYYYSTSSGLTASAHEVWITNQPTSPIGYLIGKNLTKDEFGNPIPFDVSDEDSMLNFFKRITMETPDLNAGLHRWKIEITPLQLKNMLNTNLKAIYQQYPNSILTYAYGSGEWVSQTIPNEVGEVYDMYVDMRGESGVVMSLIITTSSGTYQIWNQYNIRFTIRPKDGGTTIVRHGAKYSDLTYTSTQNNSSILPSGFFSIENNNGNYVFYGGGSGHGVGMSQYGAHGLGSKGQNYQQILESYYSNIDLVNITYQYTVDEEFTKWFSS